MFCIYCGKKIDESHKTCSFCGRELYKSPSVGSGAPVAPQKLPQVGSGALVAPTKPPKKRTLPIILAAIGVIAISILAWSLLSGDKSDGSIGAVAGGGTSNNNTSNSGKSASGSPSSNAVIQGGAFAHQYNKETYMVVQGVTVYRVGNSGTKLPEAIEALDDSGMMNGFSLKYSPSFMDDKLYFISISSSSSAVHAMSLKDGKTISADAEKATYLRLDGKDVYIVEEKYIENCYELRKLDPKTLKVTNTWKVPMIAENDFMVLGGKFYFRIDHYYSQSKGDLDNNYSVLDLKSEKTEQFTFAGEGEYANVLCGTGDTVVYAQGQQNRSTDVYIKQGNSAPKLLLSPKTFDSDYVDTMWLDGKTLYVSMINKSKYEDTFARINLDQSGLQRIDMFGRGSSVSGEWVCNDSVATRISNNKITEQINWTKRPIERTVFETPILLEDIKIK